LDVGVVEVCEEGKACYVSKVCDWVELCGEENCWDCCDEEVVKEGIGIVPQDEFRE
jgi:hypothetical protein